MTFVTKKYLGTFLEEDICSFKLLFVQKDSQKALCLAENLPCWTEKQSLLNFSLSSTYYTFGGKNTSVENGAWGTDVYFRMAHGTHVKVSFA